MYVSGTVFQQKIQISLHQTILQEHNENPGLEHNQQTVACSGRCKGEVIVWVQISLNTFRYGGDVPQGTFPSRWWIILFLPGQRHLPRRRFGWWTQPCKSQAAGGACSFSEAGLDHGTLFEGRLLLGRDGIHFSKWDKGIFASRMADLPRRS